jgi:PAS domain S-box-containing protein
MEQENHNPKVSKLKEKIHALEEELGLLRAQLSQNEAVDHPFFSRIDRCFWFDRLAESSSDIIWMTDEKGILQFISAAQKQILGYDDSEILGKPLADLVISSQQSDFLDAVDKLINNHFNGRLRDEYKFVKKNGKTIWSEIHLSPVSYEGQNYRGFLGILRDTTEYKLSEEVLRESQELYRSLVEYSPEGICIAVNWEIKYTNPAFARIVGATSDQELLNKSIIDFIDPEFHQVSDSRRQNVMEKNANNEPAIMTYRRLDRKKIQVEVTSTPILFHGRKAAQIIIRDLTEKHKTQKELERERELMDTLIMNLPDMIYFKNQKHQFIKVNHAFAHRLGYSDPGQMIGKRDVDIFGYEHDLVSANEEKNIMQTGESLVNINRHESWQNKKIWVSVTKMPLYGSSHEVIGSFGVTRDITAQKEYEEQLRAREEHFRQLFDQAPIGMCIINDHSEVLRFNYAITDILGYVPSEMVGMNMYAITHNEDKKLSSEMYQKLISGEVDKYQIEKRYIKKDGSLVHVILQVVRLYEPNKKEGNKYLCQIVNINARKLVEEELMVRNNELTNFVYKVSHDLRAPLTSVKGIIQLLGMQNEIDKVKEFTDMISNRVDRLDVFIKDILSHSRNLYTEISIEKINIEETVHQCFAQMAYHPAYNRIQQNIEIKNYDFYSDLQRFNEIMRNLISNAIIYSRKGHDESYVRVNVQVDAKECRILVEDNGLGIPEDYQKRVFEMFYRANDIVEGSGIGLYIVQQSVLKLGGKVSLQSKVNQGSTFTIVLPNHQPEMEFPTIDVHSS